MDRHAYPILVLHYPLGIIPVCDCFVDGVGNSRMDGYHTRLGAAQAAPLSGCDLYRLGVISAGCICAALLGCGDCLVCAALGCLGRGVIITPRDE